MLTSFVHQLSYRSAGVVSNIGVTGVGWILPQTSEYVIPLFYARTPLGAIKTRCSATSNVLAPPLATPFSASSRQGIQTENVALPLSLSLPSCPSTAFVSRSIFIQPAALQVDKLPVLTLRHLQLPRASTAGCLHSRIGAIEFSYDSYG